ncbi:class II aldolase/adducin family protein [Acidocella sp.]|jgi:ribulose-5-phosphate 4-epimerase/fuculose-1-phosphate aldolase|uniref:class II aldolase/adducin family protein n=1 Tax=Acidocella sp. TaxID=50710 RepID=UPI002F3F4143
MGHLQADDRRIPTPIGGPLPEPPAFETFEQERRYRKLKLAAAFRIFARFGMAEGIAGHITVRDPEFHDRFWVNPYAQHFSSIHPDDLICIDDDAHVYHGSGPVNAAAAAIHCGIHASNENVVAAAHTHTTYGRAFSARSRLLAPINQEACLFYGDHVLFKGDIVVLAADEGRRIAAAMGEARAAILLNHGLLTVGSTVDAAAYRFIAMERCCQVQLLAEAAGATEELSEEDAQSTHNLLGSDYVAWLGFQGLYQQLLRDAPDLRALNSGLGLA